MMSVPRRSRSAAWVGTAAAAVMLAVAGCASPPPATAGGGEPRPLDRPAVASLIDAHNRRVRLLHRIGARGVLELRWIDQAGERHFEPQVDADLWLDLPRRTALRAEKLGNVYLWLGSDDQRYWMFDLSGRDRRLYVGRHGGNGTLPLLVKPLAMVDLLGMSPLPPLGPGSTADTVYSEVHGAWAVRAAGAGGPMRVYLTDSSPVPVRVETLSPLGEVVLFSELSRPRSVVVPGISQAALPRLPTMINIADGDRTVAIKLALGEVRVDREEVFEKVFDLDRLVKHLRPDAIRELDDPLGAAIVPGEVR